MAFINSDGDDYKKNKKKKKVKIDIKFSIDDILRLIQYTTSFESEYFSKKNIVNLKKFLGYLDEDVYDEEEVLQKEYFRLLLEIVDLVIELDDTVEIDEIYNKCYDNLNDEYVSDNTLNTVFQCQYLEECMSEERIQSWNTYIQEKLDFITIFGDVNKLQSVIDAFKVPNPNMKNFSTLIPQARDVINSLARQLNTNVMNTTSQYYDFNPMDKLKSRHIIQKTLSSQLNPGNKISTGIRMLDAMIDGGLEGKRVYTLVGIPKRFKSGTMLNIVLNIASEYVDYRLKDTSKTPAILYITQENSIEETFVRIFEYFGLDFENETKEYGLEVKYEKNRKGKEIKKYKLSDKAVEIVYKKIMEYTYEKTGIVLRVRYIPPMTVDTSILDSIYDEYLNIDGQELIMVAHDYIKKIRSQSIPVITNAAENRLVLGAVIDEFEKFAKNKEIPVLTISQINREGVKLLEEAAEGRKKQTRKINAGHIGDSNLIAENSDVCILINREEDDEGNDYQSFKMLMSRVKDCGIHEFYQPFDDDPRYNGFRIVKDIILDHSVAVEQIYFDESSEEKKVKNSSNEGIKGRSKNRNNAEASKILDEMEEDSDEEDISSDAEEFLSDDDEEDEDDE